MNCPRCQGTLPADRTGTSDGLCPKCRMGFVIDYYSTPKVDMMNMPKDEQSLDKQRMVDEQGFDDGGHYWPEVMAERNSI